MPKKFKLRFSADFTGFCLLGGDAVDGVAFFPALLLFWFFAGWLVAWLVGPSFRVGLVD